MSATMVCGEGTVSREGTEELRWVSPQGLLTRWAQCCCALEQVESCGLGWRLQAPPHQPGIPAFWDVLGAREAGRRRQEPRLGP